MKEAQRVLELDRGGWTLMDANMAVAAKALCDKAEEIIQVYELLDQLSAAMDNTLLQFGGQMFPGDLSSRRRLANEARTLLETP